MRCATLVGLFLAAVCTVNAAKKGKKNAPVADKVDVPVTKRAPRIKGERTRYSERIAEQRRAGKTVCYSLVKRKKVIKKTSDSSSDTSMLESVHEDEEKTVINLEELEIPTERKSSSASEEQTDIGAHNQTSNSVRSMAPVDLEFNKSSETIETSEDRADRERLTMPSQLSTHSVDKSNDSESCSTVSKTTLPQTRSNDVNSAKDSSQSSTDEDQSSKIINPEELALIRNSFMSTQNGLALMGSLQAMPAHLRVKLVATLRALRAELGTTRGAVGASLIISLIASIILYYNGGFGNAML